MKKQKQIICAHNKPLLLSYKLKQTKKRLSLSELLTEWVTEWAKDRQFYLKKGKYTYTHEEIYFGMR